MKKKHTKENAPIIAKCDYCKHNQGENEKFGFMWHCDVLGHCVGFGYKRRRSSSEPLQYCKAIFLGKGSFVLDEVKYREYKNK